MSVDPTTLWLNVYTRKVHRSDCRYRTGLRLDQARPDGEWWPCAVCQPVLPAREARLVDGEWRTVLA